MKSWRRQTLAALTVTVLTSGVVQAAPTPVYELKGITVSALRQAEHVSDVPAQMSVITEKEIRDRNIQTVAQAVSRATGVYAENSQEGNVNIRGYSTKNILVLVDGQEVNSAWNGSVDWNMIPIDNIRKIEVVNGGQSSLYGGRAVGGVIHIVTKNATENGLHGNVNVSYGSLDTVKQSYMLQGRSDKWFYGVQYEKRSTDGWRSYLTTADRDKIEPGMTGAGEDAEGNPIVGDRGRKEVNAETYGLTVGYDFDEERKLSYKLTHSAYDWKYNDSRTYMTDKTWPASASSSLGTWGWREYDMHSLTYNDQKNKIHAHVGLMEYTKDTYTSPSASVLTDTGRFDGGGNQSSYPSKEWDFDLNKRWEWTAHTLLAGISYSTERFDEDIYKKVENWKINDSAVIADKGDQWLGGKSRMYSFYVQDAWKFAPKWTAYVGGRYDHYKKYDGYSRIRGETDIKNWDSGEYGQFSPKLSLSYAADHDTKYYLSFGKSFNPPLLYQVYRYSEYQFGNAYDPNPDLKPETTTNWELGLKKNLGNKTKLTVNLFHAKTTDYIDLVVTGNEELVSGAIIKHKQNQNIGEAVTHGAEITLEQTWSSLWSGYVNYTWQTGKVNGAKNEDIPRHLVHTGVTYGNEPWTVNVDGMFISDRTESGKRSGYFEARDAYFLLNLNVGYAVNENLSVLLSVDNVFDREYYDEELTSDKYYVGNGRTYTIGGRYRF